MSLLVANAEHALAMCLECMQEVLTSCIEDAMPQTSLSLTDELENKQTESCKYITNLEHSSEQSEQQRLLLQVKNESNLEVYNDVAVNTIDNKIDKNTSKSTQMTLVLTNNAREEEDRNQEYHIKRNEEEKEQEENNDIPDTLRQRLEWEMAQEQHRVVALREQLRWRVRELQSALVQLGGGVNESGQLVDIPVENLDRDIAKLSADNAKLGQQMIELYNEADSIANRLTHEIMSASVENL